MLVGPGTLEHPGLSPRAACSPGARFLDFSNGGSTPVRMRRRRWKFCIRIAPVWTCIRNRWWPAFATWWMAGARPASSTFQTTTQELMALSDWLSAEGCTHIAMEATGVYWKPVWHILSDGEFELVLCNATHVKNVPGRKTDVNDATWLADLMAHGLVRASFVPPEPTQQMRDLLRTRKQFVRERSGHVQRIQKTLEDANIKLDSVITDIVGLSGRRMIEALIAGQTDPEVVGGTGPRRHPGQQARTGGGVAWPGDGGIIVLCCACT